MSVGLWCLIVLVLSATKLLRVVYASGAAIVRVYCSIQVGLQIQDNDDDEGK